MEDLLVFAVFIGTGIGLYFWIGGGFDFLRRHYRRW